MFWVHLVVFRQLLRHLSKQALPLCVSKNWELLINPITVIKQQQFWNYNLLTQTKHQCRSTRRFPNTYSWSSLSFIQVIKSNGMVWQGKFIADENTGDVMYCWSGFKMEEPRLRKKMQWRFTSTYIYKTSKTGNWLS